MIVVASNWAIGDGTLVPAAAASLGSLAATVHRTVIRAGVGVDGRYRPVENLDLVLAGDTFDWLVSAAWLGDAKPWHASNRSFERLATVARRSIRLGRAVLGPLLRWARRGLPLPAGMSAVGRRHTLTVPVRVTVLTGDRDAAVERVLGGRRSFSAGRRWDDGRVSIRHGHDRDPVCRANHDHGTGAADRPPTLGESVAVDLLARFAMLVAARTVRAGVHLRRIADAGVVGMPEALGGWLTGLAGGPDAARVSDAWQRSVDGWWREARRCVPTCEAEFDVVDALAGWLAAAIRPGAEACPMAAGLGALVAAPAAGGPGAVEGHLRSAGMNRAIGLAWSGGSASPLAVCTSERGWPRWQIIELGDEAGPIVAIRPRATTCPADRHVVDAA
jgi:hypothetical protein